MSERAFGQMIQNMDPPSAELAVAHSWPLLDCIILVGCHGALFLTAHWFFARLLYRDYEVKYHYIQILFSETFAASCSMFVLLLATMAGAFDPDTRALAWNINHWVVVVNAYVVLPTCFIYNIVRTVCRRSRRLAFASCCLGIPLFWHVIFLSGQLIGLDSSSHSPDVMMARIGALGVTVVATLSGFGAVNFPFRSMHSFLRPVTQQQVADVEQKVLGTLKLIATKKREAVTMQVEEARLAAQLKAADPTPSFLRRFSQRLFRSPLSAWEAAVASVKGVSDVSARRKRLSTEIRALEAFSRELFLDLDELIHARLDEIQARTHIGRLMNVLGGCCSLICVYKVIMSSVNLLLRRGNVHNDDPATNLLRIAFVHLGITLNIEYWAPVLSMVFVGYLTFANTRQFIHRLLAVFRMVSTSVTSNSLVLLLSEVMAMYFAACVLLTLRFVPKADRGKLLHMVGEVDLSFVHLHFDYVFLVSSLSSVAVFSISHLLRRGPPDSSTHCD